jgi:hypothetical protein
MSSFDVGRFRLSRPENRELCSREFISVYSYELWDSHREIVFEEEERAHTRRRGTESVGEPGALDVLNPVLVSAMDLTPSSLEGMLNTFGVMPFEGSGDMSRGIR